MSVDVQFDVNVTTIRPRGGTPSVAVNRMRSMFRLTAVDAIIVTVQLAGVPPETERKAQGCATQ